MQFKQYVHFPSRTRKVLYTVQSESLLQSLESGLGGLPRLFPVLQAVLRFEVMLEYSFEKLACSVEVGY